MAKRTKGLGTMRWRSDGRWEGRFVVEHKDGKPVYKSVYADTQAECELRLEEAKQNYETEREILLRCPYLSTPYPTVRDWYEIWIETFCKIGVKPSTYENHKNAFRIYILPVIGKTKLAELSVSQCMAVISGAEKHNLSPQTIKNIKVSLQTCLQKAVDEGILSSNPAKKVKLPKHLPTEMKTLSASEVATLLETAKECDMYEFYYLLVTTGIRKGEILALEWSDFNPDNNTISINKTLSRVNGKYVPSAPKTASSSRLIKISDKCTQILLELNAKSNSDCKIMFPNSIGGYRCPSHEGERLHKILEKGGLPRIRFHDLRHTFATLSLENGVDVKTVSHILGHTDAGFTMNTYMHVTDTMQQNVAKTISQLIHKSEEEFDN